MKKNILIIGCGKMGLSHLKSFVNKPNLNIYIFDKNKTNFDFISNNNIYVLKNLRSLPKINFCIISTDSKPRFKILKQILEQKKIKIFLIEKFIFQKVSQYEFLSKNYYTKNIYVNVWGKFIYFKIKKWLKKFSSYDISIITERYYAYKFNTFSRFIKLL